MMNNLFKLSVIFSGLLMASCASTEGPKLSAQLNEKMQNELKKSAANQAKQATPAAVNKALLPDLKIAMPQTASKKIEPRFDLVVNNAPAAQVLMGIVNGTPYSMLLPASIAGTISVNLKNVTVPEALDSLRALYGFEYTIDGTRIMVEPQSMQTRVFQVNYIVGSRKGSSDTQVNSGSVRSNSTNGAQGNATGAVSNNSTGSSNTSTLISSSISTTSNNDFWGDLGESLNSLIGKEDGRKVIVNTQSGVIVVRAMPAEIRQVEKFLRLMQVNIERQVILEAKILNVQLNNDSQSGVNWSVFGRAGNTSAAVGSINANGSLATTGNGNLINGNLSATASNNVLSNAAATNLGGPLFAVALQGANISALLSFLETQGDVEVLSSPRIATINNQKAVLKVGTDEFFVTGVSQNTVASVGATTSSPQVTLQSFFSGISLDVTPQIDKDDNIILHMHPSISQVSTVNKQLTLGGANSQINLPLASSAVSETDSIVRTKDGSVIAIGGLMTENKTTTRSKVPVLGDLGVIGKAFRQNSEKSGKAELVILLKATVIQSADSWSDDMLASQQRIKEMKRNLTEN
jgi:MSHA biogenesis protein MshL